MSYRELTPEEKEQIVATFRQTRSAVVTGAVWGIDPAEVMAVNFFHGQPEDPPPSPTPAKSAKSLVLVRRTA